MPISAAKTPAVRRVDDRRPVRYGADHVRRCLWNVFMNDLDAMLADPEGVAAGKPEAIASLFAGLTLSGIAMQVAKSSRPASCTEHLFSHVLDMTHHRYNGKFQSHGFQVAIGTLTMCAFFDEFFKMDLSTLDVDACVAAWPSLEAERRGVRSICSAISPCRSWGIPRSRRSGTTPRRFAYNSRESRRTGPPSRHGCRRSAIRSRRCVRCSPPRARRPILRRSGVFARAVAQHGRFHAVDYCAGASICSIWPNAHGFTMNWSPASSARAELGKSQRWTSLMTAEQTETIQILAVADDHRNDDRLRHFLFRSQELLFRHSRSYGRVRHLENDLRRDHDPRRADLRRVEVRQRRTGRTAPTAAGAW